MTDIEDWELVDVFEFYEKPLMYTSRLLTEPGKLFMNYFVEDKEDTTVYMTFPIEEKSLIDMMNNVISYKEMLMQASPMYLMNLHIEKESLDVTQVNPADLPEDYFPDADIFLNQAAVH